MQSCGAWVRKPAVQVTFLVLLGLVLRTYHYLRNPSMWHDEAALVVNVLGKSYSEMLGPLFFSEAAPPLFLWLEKGAVDLLGDETWALRLLPFLASCAALLLFVPLTRRLLPEAFAPAAVLLMACADQILWHTCEAKPYAFDVLNAVILLNLFTMPGATSTRLAAAALLAPFCIALSYPACFLFGGLLVAWLPAVWRERQPRAWLCYGLLILAVFGTFGWLLTGPIRAQRDPIIVECWKGSFPNLARPWTIPYWSMMATFEVFRYCCEPIGQVLLPICIVGMVVLGRQGRWELLAALVIPLSLAWIASFPKAYPFSGSRVIVYSAPAVYLLIALGLQPTLAQARRWRPWAPIVPVLFVFCPLVWAGYTTLRPWPRADCAGAADLVLQNLQPGDRIAANHWEYQYYFRHVPEVYSNLRQRKLDPPASRLWLVVTDAKANARQQILRAFGPKQCRILEQQEFTRTTVTLLEREPESFEEASFTPAAAPRTDER